MIEAGYYCIVVNLLVFDVVVVVGDSLNCYPNRQKAAVLPLVVSRDWQHSSSNYLFVILIHEKVPVFYCSACRVRDCFILFRRFI